MITLDTVARFSWGFAHRFFLETPEGNFIWSDPDYPYGTNHIYPFHGDHEEWLKDEGIPFSRDKWEHRVGDYCGPHVIFTE